MKFKIVDQSKIFQFASLNRIDKNFKIHVEQCGCVTLQGHAPVLDLNMPWLAGFSVIPHILVYCRQHTKTWFDDKNKKIIRVGINCKSEPEKQFETDTTLLLAHWTDGQRMAFTRRGEGWCFEEDEAFRDHIRTADLSIGQDFVLAKNFDGYVVTSTYPFYQDFASDYLKYLAAFVQQKS